MIVAQLATTLSMRQESRGMQAVNVLVPDFSSFTLLWPWEPGYEQID
jgi:hypothetical protein